MLEAAVLTAKSNTYGQKSPYWVMIVGMPSEDNVSYRSRIRNAWAGRISGCMLGKPIEHMSMRKGREALRTYLANAGALPLRDYVPLAQGFEADIEHHAACRDQIERAIPDDDINYTLISLLILEDYGRGFATADVGRAWLRYLPGAMVFTAEREAYARLLAAAGMRFPFGAPPAFDIEECSDNEYNDWIGAQIRADLYGWVTPGEPAEAAALAQTDAALTHRGEGVHGAVVIAVAGSLIAAGRTLPEAMEEAATYIPSGSDCAAAVSLGLACADDAEPSRLHAEFDGMSPVHTVNNLSLVTWGLARHPNDFSAAIGDTVSAGWDTDCNGATVGGLWGLTGRSIPDEWVKSWNGVVETSLSGFAVITLEELVDRTLTVAT